MKRVAIIGTGIAGLGCAHLLKDRFDLALFDQAAHVGGHSNTVSIPEEDRAVSLDTGFMVYNEVTYPNLTRLFRELQVATKPTSMSFSVHHAPSGIEFCGSSLNLLFGQRKNLINPRFWSLLNQVRRFNAEAVQSLQSGSETESLHDFVAARGYGDDFLNLYLIPMSAAVWSAPPDKMLVFPARTLIRFFHNHGFLGLHTQHPWRTVVDGSKQYVDRLIAPIRNRIRLNQKVVRLARTSQGISVTLENGAHLDFDHAICASHADQTLRILHPPLALESQLLSAFSYQPNLATVHTDSSVMPRTRRCWASWNYHVERNAQGQLIPSTVYWMNSLQGVSDRTQYFVSVNGADRINPQRILKQIPYEHPLFDADAIRAQQTLQTLNASPSRRIFFCGSYFKYGFHEDALTSAILACRALTGESLWA